LFDGQGNEFEAVLAPLALNETRSQASVLRGGPVDRETKLHITLVQALCAQEKIDWLVEKCVELGVGRLILAPTARSVVRLDGRAASAAPRAGATLSWPPAANAAATGCRSWRWPTIWQSALIRAQPAQRRWILDPDAIAGTHKRRGGTAGLRCRPGRAVSRRPRPAWPRRWDMSPSGSDRACCAPRPPDLAAISALLALHGELA
jgi:hypothetical protein